MAYKSLEELFKSIEKRVMESLENEVANKVKEVMKVKIQEVVYDVYDPLSYRRREDRVAGGLKHEDSFSVKPIKESNKVGIKFRNVSSDYHENRYRDVAKIVETGVGYLYQQVININGSDEVIEIGARPFTQETYKEIRSKNLHKHELIDGLESRNARIKR